MNDPHVEKLFYRLEMLSGDSFNNPPPITDEIDAFRLKLENDAVTLEFKDHFASVSDARAVAENYLRAWELDDALRRGEPTIKFSYKDAEVIDRNPPPPGSSQVINLAGVSAGVSTSIGRITISRGNYPTPPKHFGISADVETLWQRYVGFLEGREPLQSMAYFCLTVLEKKNARNRKQAAQMYNISRAVLERLGELSSEKGDDKTARKAKARATPLNPKEVEWIKAAIRMIIRRVGELNAGSALPTITMNDLPPL